MKKIKLIRLFETENSTIGRIFIDDKFFSYTLELKWRNNQRSISCIPKGEYELKLRETENRGKHLMLLNTAPRQFILIHSASTFEDLRGCIALGYRLQLEKEAVLSQSKIAISAFNDIVFKWLETEKVFLVVE